MIGLLAKIFLKNKEEAKKRQAYGTLCSIVGIMLNILLFAGKYFAGLVSGSVAITADAFNNLSDAGSSFITLVGFLFAGKKPDSEHPFGHGRFEYISGFVVSVAILMMAFELLKTSLLKIIHPEPVDTGTLATMILIVSVFVKLYMAIYNHTIGKKIDSAAMAATAMDSLSDMVATFVVLIAMLVMRYTGINIDGICGLLVSAFIFYAGIKAARETMDPLLGTAPSAELVDRIEGIVMSHDHIEGLHDLVVHDYGPGRRMVSLHVEVPGNRDIFVIHDEIDHIERELKEELECDAVIHMDPIEVDNEEIKRMKKVVAEAVCQIHKDMTIHDFRMVPGPTHTNLIFDAVMPYGMKQTRQEVRREIEEMVENLDGDYYAVVEIDQSYVKNER